MSKRQSGIDVSEQNRQQKLKAATYTGQYKQLVRTIKQGNQNKMQVVRAKMGFVLNLPYFQIQIIKMNRIF
jgi:hypothetical protein